MGSLCSLYIKKSDLEMMIAKCNNEGTKGIPFTASINDDSDQWGKNISIYLEQSQEQRQAKAPKTYIGSGKVFWTDGKITKATGGQAHPPVQPSEQPGYTPNVQAPGYDEPPF